MKVYKSLRAAAMSLAAARFVLATDVAIIQIDA
jgi:hypothetical protein